MTAFLLFSIAVIQKRKYYIKKEAKCLFPCVNTGEFLPPFEKGKKISSLKTFKMCF